MCDTQSGGQKNNITAKEQTFGQVCMCALLPRNKHTQQQPTYPRFLFLSLSLNEIEDGHDSIIRTSNDSFHHKTEQIPA